MQSFSSHTRNIAVACRFSSWAFCMCTGRPRPWTASRSLPISATTAGMPISLSRSTRATTRPPALTSKYSAVKDRSTPSARSAQATRLSDLPTPARWCSPAPMIRFRSSSWRASMQDRRRRSSVAKMPGIKLPKDLEERSIANPAGGSIPDLFPAYAKAAGIDASKVKWVVASSESLPTLLAANRTPCVGQFIVGEPLLRAQAAPAKLVRFAYADSGLSYYGNGLIAKEIHDRDQSGSRPPVCRCHGQRHERRFCTPRRSGRYHAQIPSAGGCRHRSRRNRSGGRIGAGRGPAVWRH